MNNQTGDNVIPFPVQPAVREADPLAGKSHGWTYEAMRDYDAVFRNREDREGAIHMRRTLSLAERFEEELLEIEQIYGPSKAGVIESMNIAADYAEHRDELGNFLVEGVHEYYSDDDWGYHDQYYG